MRLPEEVAKIVRLPMDQYPISLCYYFEPEFNLANPRTDESTNSPSMHFFPKTAESIRWHLLGAGIALLCVFSPGALALESVTLQLKWLHQFQFAGYYAAQEKGFYRDAGLDVRLVEARPDTDVTAEVTAGRAEYGVGTSALVLARQKGQPVVVLAVIFQHSPLILLGRSASGINSIHDLKGKRLMLEAHEDELRAYLRREGVPETALQIVPHTFDLNDLIEGKVDAISAYSTDEPFFLDQAKVPHITLSPRSAGIDFYGDNLFTAETEIKNHPERAKAFRDASLKGWNYAMAHPEEIADLISQRYSNRHSREHLLYEARRMTSLVRTDLLELGYMHEGRWQHIIDTYAELGLLTKDFSIAGLLYNPASLLEQERRWLTASLVIALALGLIAVLIAIFLLRFNRRLQQETAARTQAVAERNASEIDFRFIAENTGDVIWVMSLESGRFTYISPSVFRLRGFTPEEIMALPVDAALTPDSAARVRTMLGESIARWEAGDHSDTMNVTEVEQPHKDGSLISTEVVTTLHPDAEGNLGYVLGVTRDITERKRAEEAIRHLAFYDPLTQLPNRRLMLDRLPQLITRTNRDQTALALLFIDLDKFKPINDTHGHAVGDWLLQIVAKRILDCLRASDTAARIGGDEFVVLLPEMQTSANALAVAEKIRSALEQPFLTPDGMTLNISSSIGVALYPEHGQTAQDLLRLGDQAMYRAKKAGRNAVEMANLSSQEIDAQEIGPVGRQLIRLTWKTAFASGNSTIDREHRELVQLTNNLLDHAINSPAERAPFNEAFDALLAHVVEHFANEEATLLEHDYPDLKAHIEQHQMLIDRALKLRHQANEGGVSLGELVDFLVSEVVSGHMLQSDQAFYGLFPEQKEPFHNE